MRIIALLSWYDENPAWLAELVASMTNVGVSHVVAVDGAFGLYPHATGASQSEQAQVVAATAMACGMGVTVHVPDEPWWGNEVEKRSFLFKMGHAVAEPDRNDWLLVCDGDEVITAGHFATGGLASTEHDVAEVMLWEGASFERAVNKQMIRKLFRAHPGGIRVDGHHARYVDGDDRVLWDSRRPLDELTPLQLWDFRIRHRPGARELYRTRDRHAYYDRRTDQRIEVI